LKKTNFLQKILGKPEKKEEEYQSLDTDTKDMIRGIVELSETNVKEIMVPRIDVVFIPVDADPKELYDKIVEFGFSRYPVYNETIDNVIGVLYVKDLIQAMVRQEPVDVSRLIRKPYFVPESKRLDTLLREFKRRRVHIAIAVDEYGGVSGIACMEDVIEEIVGDIQDEFDNEREDILSIGEGVYLCDARVNIEDLNEELGLALPAEDFDTLGGFVFDLFGKIPVRYEKVSHEGADYIIQEMSNHKIQTIKIVKRGERVVEG